MIEVRGTNLAERCEKLALIAITDHRFELVFDKKVVQNPGQNVAQSCHVRSTYC